MAYNDIFWTFANAFLSILVPILVPIIIAWALPKAIAAWKKLKEQAGDSFWLIDEIVKASVKAAEQSNLAGFIQDKKSYAIDVASTWLKNNNITIFTTELQASEWYHKTDFTKPSAIVMGSESEGLSRYWRENADNRIKIPMNGFADSLNVSVSTAVICFEALRQRDFKF